MPNAKALHVLERVTDDGPKPFHRRPRSGATVCVQRDVTRGGFEWESELLDPPVSFEDLGKELWHDTQIVGGCQDLRQRGKVWKFDCCRLNVIQLPHPLLDVLMAQLFADDDLPLPKELIDVRLIPDARMLCGADAPVRLLQQMVPEHVRRVYPGGANSGVRLSLHQLFPRGSVIERNDLKRDRGSRLLNRS